MVLFKCLKKCKGKKEDQVFVPEGVYDLTIKRVNEIEENIEKQPKFKGTGPYFERADEPENVDVNKEKEADEKVDAKDTEKK